jgi:hypothetical protein
MSTMNRLHLREAFNVDDLKQRDALVRRGRVIRQMAVHEKTQIDRWNAEHPAEPAIATEFEDAVIAWCDGVGDEGAIDRAFLQSRGVKTLGETESSSGTMQ